MSEQFLRMELKGVATDAHERFPIKFDYGQSGTAYFTGCKLEAVEERGGNSFTNRIDIQAFGDVAEQLSGVIHGSELHLKGAYGKRKGKDEKYYEVVTIDEVISVE